ncbi:hypothetical protein RF55_17594 [Lasius niger]|uniref:Uncharacterized protein n=1 Tax=Lasius niger TaxID=67767 RepID=A0A0J7K266_LASNI|nr:hypothetical protein RF55_17594 [Lasius niger]
MDGTNSFPHNTRFERRGNVGGGVASARGWTRSGDGFGVGDSGRWSDREKNIPPRLSLDVRCRWGGFFDGGDGGGGDDGGRGGGGGGVDRRVAAAGGGDGGGNRRVVAAGGGDGGGNLAAAAAAGGRRGGTFLLASVTSVFSSATDILLPSDMGLTIPRGTTRANLVLSLCLSFRRRLRGNTATFSRRYVSKSGRTVVSGRVERMDVRSRVRSQVRCWVRSQVRSRVRSRVRSLSTTARRRGALARGLRADASCPPCPPIFAVRRHGWHAGRDGRRRNARPPCRTP